jgi:hypothetical protein
MSTTRRPNSIEKFFSQPIDFTITAIGSMDAGEGAVVCKDVQFELCGMPGGFASEMVFNPHTLKQLMNKILVVDPAKKITIFGVSEDNKLTIGPEPGKGNYTMEPGDIYAIGQSDYFGQIPERTELKITPNPDIKPWKMVIIDRNSSEEDIRAHYKSFPDSYRQDLAVGDQAHYQSLWGMGKGKIISLKDDERIVEDGSWFFQSKVHGHWMDTHGVNPRSIRRTGVSEVPADQLTTGKPDDAIREGDPVWLKPALDQLMDGEDARRNRKPISDYVLDKEKK